MISPEELSQWADLYDLGHRNLDPDSEAAHKARLELTTRIKARWQAELPGRSITFGVFKREAIERIKDLLKERRRKPHR
jgi:hypothetical protein